MPPRGRRGSLEVRSNDIFAAFKLFDKNGDGFITRTEFLQILTRMGEGCKPMAEDEALKLWKDLLIDTDDNGDGKVSMEELSNAWGTGSAAAAAAATKQSAGADAQFASILTEAAAKQLATLWGPADTGLGRGEPIALNYQRLLKPDYSVTWHILGEAEGPELKDVTFHVVMGKGAGEGDETLEQYQARVTPRLQAAGHHQTRTVPLGFEGDFVLLQYDRYSREGAHLEGGYLLGSTVDDKFVELWQWARDISKTDKEVSVEQRLAPKGPKDDWLGYTWFGDFQIPL